MRYPAKNHQPLAGLTQRETTILSQLARGHANKEIAANLAIAVPTVRTHLRNIYEKLQARSRTEAIVKFFAQAMPGGPATNPF